MEQIMIFAMCGGVLLGVMALGVIGILGVLVVLVRVLDSLEDNGGEGE